MSQPPSQEPQQEGFKAPQDPPHGTLQPPQVHQSPAGPPQTPPPGEPAYGYPQQQYPGAPAPAGSGPIKGKTGILATAVAVVLLVGTGAWYVVSDSGDAPKKPVAGPSDDTGGRQAGDDLNTGRKPGEAKVAWLQKNEVDLPRDGDEIRGPWFVGDTVITALHRSVSGYAVADGRTKWSVDLPADICATPNSTTSDGKIVIGVKSRTSDRADCSVLQMVDLNTGKAGWKTTIKKNGTGDMLSDIGLTISGNTVIAGPTSNFNAYQVSDGKELFGTPAESCKIFAFAGGPKLIAAANCSTDDVKNPQHQVLELDRVSGKAKMTYQPPRGWKVEKVYSVDPLIVRLGLGDMSKKQHAIAAISKSGKLLSQMIPSTDDVLVASCGNTFALFDTRLEGCSGVVADANTFYMATKPKGEYGSAPTNKVIAFDLGTGEPKWTANAPVGRVVSPIRMEDGKLLLHQEPRHDMPGAVLSLPPTGGTASVLLQHPEGANRIENGFYSKYIRYEGGRSFILSKRANRGMGKKEMAQTTALVFSK